MEEAFLDTNVLVRRFVHDPVLSHSATKRLEALTGGSSASGPGARAHRDELACSRQPAELKLRGYLAWLPNIRQMMPYVV